jgi:hypothetical protein
MPGWKLLPDALCKEVLKKLSQNNISKRPEVKTRKALTFAKNGTHNFCTPEGRERNREKAIKRNKAQNADHNKSELMKAVTARNNSIKCCCLVCGKECSRPAMGMHLKSHKPSR